MKMPMRSHTKLHTVYRKHCLQKSKNHETYLPTGGRIYVRVYIHNYIHIHTHTYMRDGEKLRKGKEDILQIIQHNFYLTI